MKWSPVSFTCIMAKYSTFLLRAASISKYFVRLLSLVSPFCSRSFIGKLQSTYLPKKMLRKENTQRSFIVIARVCRGSG